MIKEVAEQLVLAIMGYREGPAVRPRAVEGNGGWLVRTARGQYAEVPERLELSEHACRYPAVYWLPPEVRDTHVRDHYGFDELDTIPMHGVPVPAFRFSQEVDHGE